MVQDEGQALRAAIDINHQSLKYMRMLGTVHNLGNNRALARDSAVFDPVQKRFSKSSCRMGNHPCQ